jgi:hypothetical protein
MALAVGIAVFPSSGQEDVHSKWADYLRPKPEECAFEKIGWQGTFWGAVRESHRVRKPILLWAMNGHPMACT